ncbi:hypothetical protein HDU96_001929 [Phlyctochytrium bullatum]|nr:hypothetical protein HDU96_001929 [Phlyctochytrium bullatum]
MERSVAFCRSSATTEDSVVEEERAAIFADELSRTVTIDDAADVVHHHHASSCACIPPVPASTTNPPNPSNPPSPTPPPRERRASHTHASCTHHVGPAMARVIDLLYIDPDHLRKMEEQSYYLNMTTQPPPPPTDPPSRVSIPSAKQLIRRMTEKTEPGLPSRHSTLVGKDTTSAVPKPRSASVTERTAPPAVAQGQPASLDSTSTLPATSSILSTAGRSSIPSSAAADTSPTPTLARQEPALTASASTTPASPTRQRRPRSASWAPVPTASPIRAATPAPAASGLLKALRFFSPKAATMEPPPPDAAEGTADPRASVATRRARRHSVQVGGTSATAAWSSVLAKIPGSPRTRASGTVPGAAAVGGTGGTG